MKFFNGPFKFVEPRDNSDPLGPHVTDKHGNIVVQLIWPAHRVDQIGAAVKETYRVGKLIEDTLNRVALSDEMDRADRVIRGFTDEQ